MYFDLIFVDFLSFYWQTVGLNCFGTLTVISATKYTIFVAYGTKPGFTDKYAKQQLLNPRSGDENVQYSMTSMSS